MLFGGTGHINGGGDPNTPCLYMFPGDSDPLFWGTFGVPTSFEWTEEQAGNFADDRRFMQSAGPFQLDPGEFNNITVGVVWARASSGGPFQSVKEVRVADDKAQALFDNCFRILDGPDAPDLSFQELDNELIMYITNCESGNNFNETYEELDPTIPEEALDDEGNVFNPDRYYRFQGYQIYQLRDAVVSVADLGDIDLARLLFQCDIEDGIAQVVNFINDPQIGLPIPTEMVDGANEGVIHTLKITEDLFADGNPILINHKTYYYMAIAYGYNNWEDYHTVDLSGQPFPYKAGRKGCAGSIRSYTAIPHIPVPENGGTVQNSEYGDGFKITRYEGQGNGNLIVDLDDETVEAIMNSGPDWRQDELVYTPGLGPVDIKVIDPLNIPNDEFELWLNDSVNGGSPLDDGHWFVVRVSTGDTVRATQSIAVNNEQIIPEWGISVNFAQHYYTQNNQYTAPLAAVIEFEDPSKPWFFGIPDQEGFNFLNWIRSGTSIEEDPPDNVWNDFIGKDDDELYEMLLDGTWAPWPLVGDTAFQPSDPSVSNTVNIAKLRELSSVIVVITSDKDRWSRVPVFEMQLNPNLTEHGDDKLTLRSSPSVNKEGNDDGSGTTGMSWFPGYAINIETGERLNMAFGEDSWIQSENGRDMMWNPTENYTTNLGAPLFGGQHWIYIFKNERLTTGSDSRMPQYDEGAYIKEKLGSGSGSDRTKVFRAINWVGSAMVVEGYSLLETDVKIRLNVGKPYQTYTEPYGGYSPLIQTPLNDGLPLYKFDTNGSQTLVDQSTTAKEALDIINVVPNPYYAYSSYENNRIDTRVKFTNLPQRCTITIYNVSGTVVRQYKKDDPTTSLDWDLKNSTNVPIAGGTYICHIDVPGVGEKILKWFGVMRPVDLENF